MKNYELKCFIPNNLCKDINNFDKSYGINNKRLFEQVNNVTYGDILQTAMGNINYGKQIAYRNILIAGGITLLTTCTGFIVIKLIQRRKKKNSKKSEDK